MLPRGEVFTPTDTVPFLVNTTNPATGEAVTWGSGAIRLMRWRAETWTEITDGVGIALTLNVNPGAGARTGLHVGSVDQDSLTNAAQAGDLYAIVGSAGTVESENMINLALAYWWVQADGLTAAQAVGVGTAVDTSGTSIRTAALVPYEGTIGASGNSPTALNIGALGLGTDEVEHHLVMCYDVSAGERHYRWATDLTAGVATLHAALPFTPENSVDTFAVLSVRRDQMALSSAGVAAVQSGLATLSALGTHDTDIKARLPTTLVSGRIDASVGAMAANVMTAAAAAADLATELQAGLATAAALTTHDGKLDTVKAKTDTLPADPADASDIAASFATVIGYIDTEIATLIAATTAGAIRSAVGLGAANLDTQLAAAQAVLDLFTSAQAELAALPADAAWTPLEKLNFVWMKLYHAVTNDGTLQTVAKANGSLLGEAAVSAVAGTVTRNKYAAP